MIEKYLSESQICRVKTSARHTTEIVLLFSLLSVGAGWYFNSAVRSYQQQQLQRRQAVERIESASESAQHAAQRADLLAGTLKPRFICKWKHDADTGGKHLEIVDITSDTMELLGVKKEFLIGKSPEIMIPPEGNFLRDHKAETTTTKLKPGLSEKSYETTIMRLDDKTLRTPVLMTVWMLADGTLVARMYATGNTYKYTEGGSNG